MAKYGQRIFAFIVRDLLHITESPKKAGELLMRLATDSKYYQINTRGK